MSSLKKIFLVLQVIVYLVAGANHFYSPASYIKIIPHYFPYPAALNVIAGLCELVFAIMLMFGASRKWGAWAIVLLMIAFVPVHVQMVIDAPFILGNNLYVSPFIAWVRLVVLQPLLILWAWWYTGTEGK